MVDSAIMSLNLFALDRCHLILFVKEQNTTNTISFSVCYDLSSK